MRFLVVAALLVSCAHRAELPSRRELDLTGLSAQLLPEPAVRAAVAGDLQGTFAEVRFDYVEPLTLVTRGCFAKGEVADSGEVVNVPQPTGEEQKLVLVGVTAFSVGGKALGALRAGLDDDEKHCIVTLGSDVLAPYAVSIDPATRRLSVARSKSHEAYVEELMSPAVQNGPDEFHLVELTRDPNSDWPLLAIRASQPKGQLTGAFLFSLTAPQSGVVDQAAGQAGLQPRAELFSQLGREKTKLPANLSRAFDLEKLELSPGFGLEHTTLTLLSGWSKPAALGVLGADVWGHFRVTVDPSAGVLILSRSRVFAAGSRQQCASKEAGQISEESCFELEQLPNAHGVDPVVTIWRDIPEGARVYLELLDEKGAPIASNCRAGVSFAASDRGVSGRHRLPWSGLEKSMAECAQQMAQAKSVALGLYQDGPLRECPGQCGFVQHVATNRVSCECASSSTAISEAERRFMEMYKQLLERSKQQGTTPQQPQTPDEPEDDPQK